MSDAMSPRERVLAALRRQPVDYVPFAPFFNPLLPHQRRGHTWNFPWPETAGQEEQVAYLRDGLGLDPIVNLAVPRHFPGAGLETRTWVEGDVLHAAVDTPSGTLRASVRYNEHWPHGEHIPFYSDFNVGHYVKPWLENEADLECFRHVMRAPQTGAEFSALKESVDRGVALARQLDLATIAHLGMGLTGAQQLFGVEPLCMLTITNPDLVDAYLELEHGVNIAIIEALHGAGVDIVRRNGFYETADFYSPEVLDRFLTKRLTGEAAAIHAGGMLMAYTANTGVMPILDYLANLPIDCLLHVDVAFHGFDLDTLRRKLRGEKSFWIGPSSTYHIWEGPEPTRRAVRDIFEHLDATGLILTPCPSQHSIMPWESFEAMVGEWRALRGG